MNKNLVATIIVSVGLFLFFAMVMPQYSAISTFRSNLKQEETLYNERTAFLESFKSLNAKVKARQTDINKVVSFLPAGKRSDEIVSSLQEIAQESGLQLTSLSSSNSASTTDTGYKKMFITVEMVGTYPSLVNLLGLMEKNLRLFDINQITAISSTTSPGLLNINLKMNAYYLP